MPVQNGKKAIYSIAKGVCGVASHVPSCGAIIENLLREGMTWAAIERITGVNEAQFQTLKQRLEALNA